jgi:O-antigen ligase
MTASSSSQASPRTRALFSLLIITLLFAPLFRAGLAPLPLLALELLAISLLGVALWNPGKISIKAMEIIVLGLVLLLPLLYLVYLPAGVLDGVPGQGVYRANLGLVSGESLDGTLTLTAFQTQTSWLVLLIPIAVFLATRSLGEHSQLRLISLLLAIAAFQATLALVQFGASQGGLLLFGFDPSGSGAAGTFPNRNHLAGLLEMTLPIALALLLYYLGRDRGDRKSGWRRKVSFLASLRGHTALVYGALAILLVLGIIFTRSRTGIALAMLGILLTTLLFSRRIGGDNVYGPTGTLVAIVVGIGVSIGLAPVLDRFSFGGALEDARWTISAAAIEGLGTFLPFGSGPGTFPTVFPAFQPLELGPWFINRAHNDYVEWVFDGGIPAALLILLLFGLYLFQWTRIYSRDTWSRYRFVQVAAGIGLLMLLIHEFFDYNLHTPAIMVVFALLAGVFFSEADQTDSAPGRRRHKRRTPHLSGAASGVETPAAKPQPTGPAADQIANPFLDDPS